LVDVREFGASTSVPTHGDVSILTASPEQGEKAGTTHDDVITNPAGTAVLEVVVNHNGQTERFQGGIMHSSPDL
jgi:hypothetical protein